MIRAALICALVAGGGAVAQTVSIDPDEVVWGCDHAGYFGPTTEYRHAVLGDDVEYKGLVILVPTEAGPFPGLLELPEGQVYEDIAPRCADLDGDGEDEVITVISDAKVGARLAIYSQRRGPMGETPPIGKGYRWLAPAGTGDFNGDGQNDVAYVEMPHVGGTLRVWTFRGAELVQIASKGGFSNHRIGEDFITGGARDCGQGAELVLPNFNWTRLMVVQMEGGELVSAEIGDDLSSDSVARALDCAD